jgi:hypothetical protein
MEVYNPESYLDSRDAFLPRMYECLGRLAVCAFVGFLLNSITHPRFRISVHSWLVLVFCLRAVSHFVSARYWELFSVTKSPSFGDKLPVWVWEILSLSGMFTVNGLLLAGWGIYRTTIENDDVLPLLNMCWIFFVAKRLAGCSSVILSGVAGLIAIWMGAWYMKHIKEWLVVPLGLVEPVGKMDEAAQRKLDLAVRFGAWFAHWAQAVGVFVVLKFMLSLRSSSTALIEEMFYLALMCMHVWLFWIRKDHEGDDDTLDHDKCESGMDKASDRSVSMFILTEPGPIQSHAPQVCELT